MKVKVIKLIPESAFSASRLPTSKAEFTHQILVQMKKSFFLCGYRSAVDEDFRLLACDTV